MNTAGNAKGFIHSGFENFMRPDLLARVANLFILVYLLANAGLRLFFVFNFNSAAKITSIAAIITCLLIMVLPRYLKWFMLLFGFSLSFFGFQPYNVYSHVFELLTTCIIIGLTVRNIINRPERINRHLIVMLISYILLALFSLQMLPVSLSEVKMILFQGRNSVQGLYLNSLTGVNSLILFSVLALQLSSLTNARTIYYYIFTGLFCSGVFAAVSGLADFYGLISLSWYREASTPGVLHGFFLNRGWFAQYVMVATPFILIGFMNKNKSFFWKLFLFSMLVVSEIALILSGARAGWVSYPLVLFFCWLFVHFLKNEENKLFHMKWKDIVKIVVFMPITILISLFVIFQVLPYISKLKGSAAVQSVQREVATDSGLQVIKEQSARIIEPSSRIHVWKDGINIGRESPLFGMGYDSFRWHSIILEKVPDSHYKKEFAGLAETPHNTFLQLFVSNGIAGLFIWLLIIGYALMVLTIDLGKNNNLINIPVIISIFVAHIHGFFQDLQYIPMIWAVIFLEIGYAMMISEDLLSDGHRKVWNIIMAACISITMLSSFVYYKQSSYDFLKVKYGIKIYRLE